VAADVSWRVIGTTPLSGTHRGKAAFREATQPFTERLAEPIVAKVLAVHGVGDTVIVQWEGTSRGTNGRPYNQSYCWVMHFTDGKIDDVVAYLDTALVNDIFA
jgi:ketosteroid isomerase-like protein